MSDHPYQASLFHIVMYDPKYLSAAGLRSAKRHFKVMIRADERMHNPGGAQEARIALGRARMALAGVHVPPTTPHLHSIVLNHYLSSISQHDPRYLKREYRTFRF